VAGRTGAGWEGATETVGGFALQPRLRPETKGRLGLGVPRGRGTAIRGGAGTDAVPDA